MVTVQICVLMLDFKQPRMPEISEVPTERDSTFTPVFKSIQFFFYMCSQSHNKCSTVSDSLAQNEHVGLFINFIL